MQIRMTKSRAAMAVLFVLAGVGLGSLLSPLVGTALATVGQTVNISDHSSSAYFAKVDSSGALKTTAAVTGKVGPALPPQPFSVEREFSIAAPVYVLGPTSATLALTDVTFANYFAAQGRDLRLQELSGPSPNTNCTNFVHTPTVGRFDAEGGQTVHVSFQTPIVLKPLAAGEAWCLYAAMGGPSGDPDYVDGLTVGGYVVSGSFTPPSSPQPAKALRATRRH
jgi:hypothetical protein